MKKLKNVLLFISANLYLPLLAVCYRLGGPFELSIFPLALMHIIVFAIITEKALHHSVLSANLALSFCSGSAISSWLYYNNVSNDAMTPVVGWAMALSTAVIFTALIAITSIVKYTKQNISLNRVKL